VNERIALHSSDVVSEFKKLGIVALKADWTSYDEKISRALAGYGRNSIPLYVLYGPGLEGEPFIFPELLTPSIVLEFLEKVESGNK
jgi:thiol:disulfide interchange protein DsbD